MLKNYLKIAFRNLWKQKIYAFINIFGLAVGLAFCALIFLYVHSEWTYDQFHENADNIYRIHRVSFTPDGSVRSTDSWLPIPLGPAMVQDLPEVHDFVRFRPRTHFVRQGVVTNEEDVLYADDNVFDVFTFPLAQGDPATALTELNSVVLSQTAALKYFGTVNPMGQALSIRLSSTLTEDFIVTGIAEDIPQNSSIQFDVLVPFAKMFNAFESVRNDANDWFSSGYVTYLLMEENASLANIDEKLLQFRQQYYEGEVEYLRSRGRWSGDGIPTSYRIQALAEIHLNPEVNSGLASTSNPLYSYILAAIALAVLAIACINFMTLAIGRSASRAKEIGVRKVVGALRVQLMGQFWAEALLMSVLALGVGLLLATLFLPAFNALTEKNLVLDFAANGSIAGLLIAATLLAGFIAGSYPALVLSGFRPVDSLKNKLKLSGSNALTKSLVVVQFGLSAFLITSTLVMLDQLDFIRTMNLGYDKEHLVVIPTNGIDGTVAVNRYRQEVGSRTDVLDISGTSYTFARGGARVGWEYEGELKQVSRFRVEQNYIDVMDMQLVAGRTFDPNLSTDSTMSVIVNEALVRDFGMTEPLGQPLTGFTDTPETDPVIIGVLKDYNFQSLETEVAPLMLLLQSRDQINYVLARITPTNVPETLAALQTTWEATVPEIPFQYNFLDDDLNTQYQDDQRWSQILSYASGFAILIACLGLFGLVSLTVAARVKEVGIRKVLGASVPSVTILLSKDFAVLVLISLVIAAPASYFAMDQWLMNFAFRTEIGVATFLISGSLALLIALATVSFQSIKAALADPVQSLRYE